MNHVEIINSVIEKLRNDATSQADVAEAVKAVASHETFLAFILLNYTEGMALAFSHDRIEIMKHVKMLLEKNKKFEQYFLSPYLAAVAIGFELGKKAH